MQLPSPNEDLFHHQAAPQALREAVEALAAQSNHSLPEMERMTLGEIFHLAQKQYGSDLPPFWSNWLEWSHDEGPQPMGEL